MKLPCLRLIVDLTGALSITFVPSAFSPISPKKSKFRIDVPIEAPRFYWNAKDGRTLYSTSDVALVLLYIYKDMYQKGNCWFTFAMMGIVQL